MRYLADILTFSRIILSIVLLLLTYLNGSAEAAFIVFLVAELTDTFDGTCARKWPFPKGKEPKYRKYASKYDMFADVLLISAQLLYVINRVNLVFGLIFAVYLLVSSFGGDLLIYGKPFGHPDDFTKHSLARRNFALAKKIILTRRYIYATLLGVLNAMILFATNWPLPVKIGLFIFGCLIFVFVWFFLRQRRENISRDAVDIEKSLSKK